MVLRVCLWFALTTLAHAFDPSVYTTSYDVPLSGITVYWKVAGSSIKLAMRAQTTGFIAFGLAEPTVGGMAGSDILVGKVVGGVASIEDRHAMEKDTPKIDGCQDWTLVAGEEVQGWTTIEVERALATGDDQDRDILVGSSPTDFNRIIVAKSNSDSFGYHFANRWSSLVHFGGFVPPTLDVVKADCCKYVCDVIPNGGMQCVPGDKSTAKHSQLKLRNDFVIPSERTTYNDAIYSFATALSTYPNGLHIVGAEAIIQNATKAYVHHFVLNDNSSPFGTLWAWVPGNGPYVLPAAAGIKIHKDDLAAVVMQTHFDNPDGKSGMKDTSGIDLYVTDQLRDHDAGMLILGDGALRLGGQLVGDKVWTFECSSSCTKGYTSDLTVIGNMFHMHKWGAQMVVNQRRAGQLVDKWSADFYDYAFENYYSRPRTIKPGDSLEVSCVYIKDTHSGSVVWGTGSEEEMCMDFIAYYPKQSMITGKHCGHQDLCGSHKSTTPSQRFPVDFGTVCSNPIPPTTSAPTPASVGGDKDFSSVYASLVKHASAHLNAGASGGLSLGSTKQSAWEAITCKASSTGKNYITPGKPEESYLLERVLGCNYGSYDFAARTCTTSISKMPPYGSGFSAAEEVGLRDWIVSGAYLDESTPPPGCTGGTDGGIGMTTGKELFDALVGEYGPNTDGITLKLVVDSSRSLQVFVAGSLDWAGPVVNMTSATVGPNTVTRFAVDLTVESGTDRIDSDPSMLLGMICKECGGQALQIAFVRPSCAGDAGCAWRTVSPEGFTSNAFYGVYSFTNAVTTTTGGGITTTGGVTTTGGEATTTGGGATTTPATTTGGGATTTPATASQAWSGIPSVFPSFMLVLVTLAVTVQL